MNERNNVTMPGRGIGKTVLQEALRVLDAVGFKANYIYADIGWEFWCKEGNPLPQRTIDLLEEHRIGFFGAITSKPKEESQKELVPELQGKGLVYSSPIVGMRQLLNLHTNMRPCIAFDGNPLNYKEGIDIVVFRENTEGLYGGVEWHPIPDGLRESLKKHHKKMAKFDATGNEDMAISTRIFTRKGCQTILRSAFEYAKRTGRKTVTVVEK